MAQANPNTITHSPADASRRRFLSVAAAASAVSVGALAARPPCLYCRLRATLRSSGAGAKLEALFAEWMPRWFEWARLHCEAKDEAVAKFGEDEFDNAAWHEPLIGTAPAFLFQLEMAGEMAATRPGENAGQTLRDGAVLVV